MRIISQAEATVLIRSQFGLEAPVTFDVLKKEYRRLSRQYHPDLGGSEEAFKVLSGAFQDLEKLAEIGSSVFITDLSQVGQGESGQLPLETIDGIPLTSFGLGLGPTTNGRDCDRCEGKGYNIVCHYGFAPCETCRGQGYMPAESICRDCHGTGKFTQARSGRVVNCRKCGGTGRFKHPYITGQICYSCFGSGHSSTREVKTIRASKCFTCDGTGEIIVLNPVILKGALMAGFG